MKSFVAYPFDIENLLFPEILNKNFSAQLIAHYELYQKISHLQGAIVNCGISTEEVFIRYSMLRNMIAAHSAEPVVAFERYSRNLYFDNTPENEGKLKFKVKRSPVDFERLQTKLQKKGMTEKIEFVPGYLADSIPEYLIENPDLKISYLSIDLDDYEASMTALQYFYPRLVHDGLMIIDNYYKKEDDFKAINDYFRFEKICISNYSVNKGPHFIVRQ